MNQEQTEAAARALLEIERRQMAERQQRESRAEWLAQAVFSVVGIVMGSSVASGFGGSPLAWGAGGLVAGRVASWFFMRAWNARRSRHH